jgi:hypothetical protein
MVPSHPAFSKDERIAGRLSLLRKDMAPFCPTRFGRVYEVGVMEIMDPAEGS